MRQTQKIFALFLILALSCFSLHCDNGRTDHRPCDGVNCGLGLCITDGANPYCDCNNGWHPEGLTCVQNNSEDPCSGVTCEGHGTCSVNESEFPECECDDGYEQAGRGLLCWPTSERPDPDADMPTDADPDGETDTPTDGDTPEDADTDVMRFFVTSTEYSQPENGLEGADERCQLAADGALLGGTWKAWLSSDPDGLDAIDRIEDRGPWYDLTGALVFNNRANLATRPQVAPNRDENGDEVDCLIYVWTGTSPGGASSSHDCCGWTKGCSGAATMGRPCEIDGWTDAGDGTYDCRTFEGHLYCLEQ